jgi:hypothetical protein
MGETQEATEATFSKDLFQAILIEFSDKKVIGGFSMTDPHEKGLGWWVQNNSGNYGNKLTPRHASFIAAILVAEGYCKAQMLGRNVFLTFSKFAIEP